MEVRLLLDGNMMAVKPLSPSLCARLEEELSYVKVEHLRGQEAYHARTKIRFVPTSCYRYARNRLITNTGFLQRIKKTIKSLGHTVVIKDLRPPQHPERLRGREDRLNPEELRYKQLEALRVCNSMRRARLDCPTGFGKSFFLRYAVEYWPDAKIDIIAPGADTAKDLYHGLSEIRGGVGLYGAGVHKRAKRVQIYCVNSLHHSNFDADIVIGDEIQEYATGKRLEQLARYENARMYGLSASHDARNDNADKELEALFGPIAMSISYAEGVDAGIITPLRVRWLPVIMDEDPAAEYEDTAKERWAIWRNKVRNKIIRDAAREYPDDQVLITVKCIEHMVFLKKLLPEFTMVHAENAMSGADRYKYVKWKLIDENEPLMTRHRRDMLKQRFEKGKLRKVIVNSVWNRGVNFHQLSVLIRADASSSKIADTQIPGRLARLHDGKEYGLLIDLMDQFNKGYRRKAKTREKNYAEKKWEQIFPQPKSRFLQGRLFA